jgi:hypothetical protein
MPEVKHSYCSYLRFGKNPSFSKTPGWWFSFGFYHGLYWDLLSFLGFIGFIQIYVLSNPYLPF